MPAVTRSEDDRLLRLAAALDEPLRRRLVELTQADSKAALVIELEQRAAFAEDVANEARLQLQLLVPRWDTVRETLGRQVDAWVIVEELRRLLNVDVPRYEPEPASEAP